MRIVLAALALSFGLTARADDEKIDAKKLVGKWTAENEDSGAKVLMELGKDGKLKLTVTEKNAKDVQVSGTYKLDGNKLVVTFKAGDKEHKETLTVVSVDDDELVIKDPKGKKEKYERVDEKQ
jgi:uncharacterized protein (TIGR03066 family)